MKDNAFISGSKVEETPTKIGSNLLEMEDMSIKEIFCVIENEANDVVESNIDKPTKKSHDVNFTSNILI